MLTNRCQAPGTGPKPTTRTRTHFHFIFFIYFLPIHLFPFDHILFFSISFLLFPCFLFFLIFSFSSFPSLFFCFVFFHHHNHHTNTHATPPPRCAVFVITSQLVHVFKGNARFGDEKTAYLAKVSLGTGLGILPLSSHRLFSPLFPITMEWSGYSNPIFTVPASNTATINHSPITTTRAGALVTSTLLLGWRATRVGLGQYPQYTRASKMGAGCG